MRPSSVRENGKSHVLQFENRLWAHRAHILDRILVTDVIGALDGVIHMPAPIVVGVSTGNGTGDATLSGNGVRARGKHLGDYRRLVTRLGKLQCCAHTSAAAADDNAVE